MTKVKIAHNPPPGKNMINALANTLWEQVFYTQVNIHPCLIFFSRLYFLKNVYCFSVCFCHLIFYSYLSITAHTNLPHPFNLLYWYPLLYLGSSLSTYILMGFQLFLMFYSFHNNALMNNKVFWIHSSKGKV